MKNHLAIIWALGFLVLGTNQAFSQSAKKDTLHRVQLPFYITPAGDTMLYWVMNEVTITAPRYFRSADDYRRYNLYRRYASSVYPYALEAVKNYRAIQDATHDMRNRDRKQYIKDMQSKLSDEFSDKLKNLTKTQGYILIKMIEREMKIPFYDIVKDLKGTFTAFYWNEFSKFYGYHLKEGYRYGDDTVLDAVLQDYPLTAGS